MYLTRTNFFFNLPLSLVALVALGLIALTVSCGGNSGGNSEGSANSDNTSTSSKADDVYSSAVASTVTSDSTSINTEVDSANPIIVFLGDSLTEGYRVAKANNYPSRVEKLLADAGTPFRVVNGGLSGETSSGGLDRLEWFLNLEPECLFVALGANDGLRGLALEETYNNLAKIIEAAQARGVDVLLAGQMLPPNYGEQYTEQFRNMYPRLAREYNVPLLPFLLAGVAGENELNLNDGIHPNSDGYAIISKNVAKFISENFKPENIN